MRKKGIPINGGRREQTDTSVGKDRDSIAVFLLFMYIIGLKS